MILYHHYGRGVFLPNQFWRLSSPDYDSDYRHIYINGDLEHPYSLPCVTCDACGENWGNYRILPFTLPDSLRTHPNLIHGGPRLVSVSEYQELEHDIREQVAKEGITLPDL